MKLGNPLKDRQIRLIAELAVQDYRHDWIMSSCYVLALAAVLMPLLVLFGLKFGIINNLLDPIKQDQRYREIVPSGSGSYTPEWFKTMASRPEVAFITPKTRAIAATMKVRVSDSDVGRIVDVELVPTATGDPALGTDLPELTERNQVILTANTADRLGVQGQAKLDGILSRILDDQQQTEMLSLTAVGVAHAGAFGRDGLFVTTELLSAIEDFRDGRDLSQALAPGAAAEPRNYAGFRLYADEIDDVDELRADLLAQGIDVRTRAADIELVRSLDLNLSIVYWVIALVSIAGFCFSFGASLWANIDRKKREFSVLRMVGFRTRGIVWFPLLQALLTGLLGWLGASLTYFAVQVGLNTMFMDNLGAGRSVCRLLPGHLILALLLTLIAAAIAASLGGSRIARMEPSAGLRQA